MLKETIFVPKKVDFSDKSQLPDLKCINLIVQQLAKSFDNIRGGFIGAPKFPQPVNFNLLLQIYQRNKDTDIGKEALKMTEITLKKMSAGGIHDHIGKVSNSKLLLFKIYKDFIFIIFFHNIFLTSLLLYCFCYLPLN